MKSKVLSALSAAVLGTALLAPSAPAQAGDLSGAYLTCYVDTFAFDTPTPDECTSYWTPGTANNPSVAFFQVYGLTPGSYTFYWTDLTPTQVGVCPTSNNYCIRSIRVGRTKIVQVTVIDNATGFSKTMVATAIYEDGYH